MALSPAAESTTVTATQHRQLNVPQAWSVRDEFSTSNALNNNDGTALWSTDWIPANEADSAIAFGDGGVLRMDNSASPGATFPRVERGVDLSGAMRGLAELTFELGGSIITGATMMANMVRIQVSDDGGASWADLATIDMAAASGAGMGTHAYVLPSTTAGVRIALEVTAGLDDGAQFATFDNVQVVWKGYLSAPTGVAVWRSVDTPSEYTLAFEDGQNQAAASFGTPFTTTTGVTNNRWRVMAGADSPIRDESIVLGLQSDGALSGALRSGVSTWSALSINDFGSVGETSSPSSTCRPPGMPCSCTPATLSRIDSGTEHRGRPRSTWP